MPSPSSKQTRKSAAGEAPKTVDAVSPLPVKRSRIEADNEPEQPKPKTEDVYMLVIGDMHFCERNFTQTEMVAALVLRFVAKYAMYIDEILLLGDLIDRLQWLNVARAQRW